MYAVKDPDVWLDTATSSRDTKIWIEKAALGGDEIFMIVDIQPVGAEHAIQHERVSHQSEPSNALVDYGENRFFNDTQVGLVQCRKVCHKWLSSRVVDMELKKNPRRWFCVVGLPNQYSYEDEDDEDEDDEDVIEVEFENEHSSQPVVDDREQSIDSDGLQQDFSALNYGPRGLPDELWTKILKLIISRHDLMSWCLVCHDFAKLLSNHRMSLAKQWEVQFSILQDTPLRGIGREMSVDELNSYDSLAVLRAFLVCRLPRHDVAVRLGRLVSSRYSSQGRRRLETLTIEVIYDYTRASHFFMEDAKMVRNLRTFYISGNQPTRLFRILEEELNFIKARTMEVRTMEVMTFTNRAVQIIRGYQSQSSWEPAKNASLDVLDIIEREKFSLISHVV